MQDLIGSQYQHYKNKKTYQIIALGHHSDTDEEMVVYQGLYHCEKFGDQPIWIRTKGKFFENVIYNGQSMPRFKKMS